MTLTVKLCNGPWSKVNMSVDITSYMMAIEIIGLSVIISMMFAIEMYDYLAYSDRQDKQVLYGFSRYIYIYLHLTFKLTKLSRLECLTLKQ